MWPAEVARARRLDSRGSGQRPPGVVVAGHSHAREPSARSRALVQPRWADHNTGMGQVTWHRPRLAWDGARAIIAAIESGQQVRMALLLGRRLDPGYERAVEDSWLRLALDPDRTMTEAGLWRARLDDLISLRPDLAPDLMAVIDEARQFAPPA